MTFPADANFRYRRRSAVSRCKGCRAPIVWSTTQLEKKMPMDAVPVEDGGWVFIDGKVRKIVVGEHFPPEVLRYTAHWETCPDRDSFHR